VLAQQQNNSDVPGSVLVFAKFIRGTVQIGTGRGPIAGPILAPRSEFNVSVTCPNGAGGTTPGTCAEGAKVKILAKWVCPASQNPAQFFICKANNFELFTTVKGTLRLNPESIGVGVAPNVPRPLCQRGFLIMWVISPDDGSAPFAIKYNGLVGHAILRNGNVSSSAYNGLSIQAVNQITPGSPTDRDVPTPDGNLDFNGGGGAQGEYKQVTGQLTGSIRLERTGNVANSNLGPIRTFLTMLTLDTLADRPNYPTFVDFHFFNEAEQLLSTSFEFICWAEVRITSIDPNLDQFFGVQGLFETTEAEKVAIFGVTDTAGPVTIIGIVETLEFRPNGNLLSEYAYNLFNDGQTVTTTFAP